VLLVCFLTDKLRVLVGIYNLFGNIFCIFIYLILGSHLTLLVRDTSPPVLPCVPSLDWVSFFVSNCVVLKYREGGVSSGIQSIAS
jgi:hypothetical protein